MACACAKWLFFGRGRGFGWDHPPPPDILACKPFCWLGKRKWLALPAHHNPHNPILIVHSMHMVILACGKAGGRVARDVVGQS
ncbi:hypothetical protein B0H12DRAFT_852398 [Mycena haematopus]|nr:hypothetical protein B0H12DRAFT_852398 [Mycena haematopus]